MKNKRWYISIFIIVNIIAMIFVYHQETQAIQKIFDVHSQEYQDEVKDTMSHYTHSFQLFSQMLTNEIQNHPHPDEIWKYLKSIDKKMLQIEGETFDGLYMYYQDRYLYSWDTPYEQYVNTGYNAKERPWYKNAIKEKGKIVFTPPYMSYANHYVLSTISQLQSDGKTVFAYDIKMGNIQKIVHTLSRYDNEQIMIFDKAGTIIGSSEEKYLGGNLNASLQEDKQVIDDVKETLAKTTVDEEIEKLKEQMDSAQSFYNFQQEFHEDYQHLTKKPQQAQLYKFNHTYYYNYLLKGDDYHILMSIPLLTLLQETMSIWLIPMLILEFVCIYILNRISKEAKNRELKAAYVELGQTQKRLEIALSAAQKAAAIDELTGMMNEKSFRKSVINQIHTMSDEDCGILIMIDGDRFKYVNDTYGHMIGDEVIKLCAQMIIGRIRTIDLASRLHGDEFAIFIANIDDYHVAKKIIQDINDSIEKEAKRRNMPVISISSGAIVVKHGDNYSELAKKADQALYMAKKAHNGAFESYQKK